MWVRLRSWGSERDLDFYLLQGGSGKGISETKRNKEAFRSTGRGKLVVHYLESLVKRYPEGPTLPLKLLERPYCIRF